MASKTCKSSSYPLRLPLTLRREIEALARSEGISINQLISLAVAEKIVRCQQQAVLNPADGSILRHFTKSTAASCRKAAASLDNKI